MTLCRTLADIEAAAAADALAEPVRSRDWADRVALILAPCLPQLQAAASP
jgi:hypothetical protein